jgi:hypothetical protein
LPSAVVKTLGKEATFVECRPAHSAKGLAKGPTGGLFTESQSTRHSAQKPPLTSAYKSSRHRDWRWVPLERSLPRAMIADTRQNWPLCRVPKKTLGKGSITVTWRRDDNFSLPSTKLSAFRPWGSLDRRVNCRRVPQPRWVGARRSAKGGKPEGDRHKRGNPRPSCLSHAQVGCACSRGLQASAWEGARGLRTRRHVLPARPTPCKRALDHPFIGVRRGSRCTMGDVAVC